MQAVRPLGLVVAMDAELIHTLRRYAPVRTVQRDVWRFHHLQVEAHELVAVRSGMGLINAAAASERLIAEFEPELVLNYGCSGAHRRDIMPGDIVIGERVVHHSALQILNDGSERYSGFGFDVAGERMDAAELATDAALLVAAESLAARFAPEPW